MSDRIKSSDVNVYDVLLELEMNQYKEYVRLFDSNRTQLSSIKIKPRIELEVGYINALFELGYYDQVLLHIDGSIEDVIQYDITEIKNQDIYRKLLFQKAASLMHMDRYDESKKIMRSLIRISENKEYFQMMYAEILFEEKHKWIIWIKNMVISFWIASAGIILVELLIVRIFFEDWIREIMFLRNASFLIGLAIFLLGFGWLKASAFIRAKRV